MGMALPGFDEPVVHLYGLAHGLIAGGVVGKGIELLRALGRAYQVEHRVVALNEFPLGFAHLPEHLGKLPVVHVGPVVNGAPVADDEDLVRLHGAGGLFEEPILGQLQLHLHLLIVQIAAAGPGSHAAGDEFGSGLRHKEDGVTQLGECVLHPAHGGGLACAGAAGDDDLAQLHGSSSPSGRRAGSFFTLPAAGWPRHIVPPV